mmetsp:Transcript_907/g.2957  ORF Transcript_907/g.2957 Transcript_907/m.2957 type:complete len:110 (-) Transcript_907:751-1080(-)
MSVSQRLFPLIGKGELRPVTTKLWVKQNSHGLLLDDICLAGSRPYERRPCSDGLWSGRIHPEVQAETRTPGWKNPVEHLSREKEHKPAEDWFHARGFRREWMQDKLPPM